MLKELLWAFNFKEIIAMTNAGLLPQRSDGTWWILSAPGLCRDHSSPHARDRARRNRTDPDAPQSANANHAAQACTERIVL
jgi:hypothetical protein